MLKPPFCLDNDTGMLYYKKELVHALNVPIAALYGEIPLEIPKPGESSVETSEEQEPSVSGKPESGEGRERDEQISQMIWDMRDLIGELSRVWAELRNLQFGDDLLPECKRIGEILCDAGDISSEQLRKALAMQNKTQRN